MICIGKIVGFFGLNGYLKVKFYREGFDYKVVFLEDGAELKVSKTKDNYLMLIDGIDTRTKAEAFLNKTIWVKELPKIDKNDEYYFKDLVGLKVIDEENVLLGTVVFVNDYGAGTFLEFEIDGTIKIATVHFNAVINVNETSITVNKDSVFYS